MSKISGTSNGAIWLMDTRGLRDFAKLSGNEAGVVLQAYNAGEILVFNRSWNEFRESYPDEAGKLPLKNITKITQEHRKSAALLAECSSQYKLVGARDQNDVVVAAIANTENLTVITSSISIQRFYTPSKIKAVTLNEFLLSKQ